MKLIKKAVVVLTVSMAVTGVFSCAYASEINAKPLKNPIVKVLGAPQERTTGPIVSVDEDAPKISSIYTEVRNGKTYLMISISDPSGVAYVKVGNSYAELYSGNKTSGVYSFQITSSGTYYIYYADKADIPNHGSTSKTVTISTKSPTVDLSQTYKNGKCYLVIKASDDGKIKKVTVNGKSISFSESGETKYYEVTKSGKYTVVVTDDAGNETTEKYTVDVDGTKPTLKVTQEYKDKKFYLIIKVAPNNDNKLSKVMVNGKSISFKSSGGEIEYEVTASGTYKVVVTDDMGFENSESISVDINSDKKIAPTLTLSQLGVGQTSYIVITAKDNDKIAKLTVNGVNVSIGAGGGTVRYQVFTSGNYTVVATDNDGNETSQSIYVTVGSSGNSTPVSKQTVKFKLNSKNWTMNGVSQEVMDTAPLNKNGRIYLPIRYTAYALGIDSGKITWDAKSQSAIIYDGSDVIKVTVGSKVMTVNGQTMTMEAAAISQNGRVLLPISQVSKAFTSKGVSLNWDNIAKEITIVRTK